MELRLDHLHLLINNTTWNRNRTEMTGFNIGEFFEWTMVFFVTYERPNVRHPSSRNLTRRANKSNHYNSILPAPFRDKLLFK